MESLQLPYDDLITAWQGSGETLWYEPRSDGRYKLVLQLGSVVLVHEIVDPVKKQDFEANHKSKCNLPKKLVSGGGYPIVELNEAGPGDKNYRNFALPPISVPAAETGWVSADWSCPYPIWVLSVAILERDDLEGKVKADDMLCAEVAPKLDLEAILPPGSGKIQAEAAAGALTMTVSPVLLAGSNPLLRPGYVIQLEDPQSQGNPAAAEYEVIGVDLETNVVTLAKITDEYTWDKVAGWDQTYPVNSRIYRTVIMGRVWALPSRSPVVYGESKIGGAYLPANTTFRVRFKKKGGDTADGREVRITLEALY